MKFILIWSWINLSTGTGFTIQAEYPTAEKCLQVQEQIEQQDSFTNSRIVCVPEKLS